MLASTLRLQVKAWGDWGERNMKRAVDDGKRGKTPSRCLLHLVSTVGSQMAQTKTAHFKEVIGSESERAGIYDTLYWTKNRL